METKKAVGDENICICCNKLYRIPHGDMCSQCVDCYVSHVWATERDICHMLFTNDNITCLLCTYYNYEQYHFRLPFIIRDHISKRRGTDIINKLLKIRYAVFKAYVQNSLTLGEDEREAILKEHTIKKLRQYLYRKMAVVGIGVKPLRKVKPVKV